MRFDETAFYGRARRLAIVRSIVIIIVIIVVLFFVYKLLRGNEVTIVDNNINFAYLKDHFKSKGYSCDRLEKDGGRCVYDVGNNYMSFTRYNDGFVYLVKTNSYTIQFRHVKSTYNDFKFITNENALAGVKNSEYYCITSNDIFGEFDSCSTVKGVELTTESYIGAIENALSNMNAFIDASGYDRDALIEKYEWQKK